MMTKPRRVSTAVAAVAVTTLASVALSSCSGQAANNGSSGSGGGGDSSSKTITFGVIPGWTDETSTTYLLKNVLESKGYTVKITELTDNAPMYIALSKGSIDVQSSMWPDRTHKPYWDKYGSGLEDLDTWNSDAGSFLAVPNYSDIQSISDLPSHASEFGGKIVGIEPGAGLTKMTQNSVIPAYGLDSGFKLVTSSTPAMLTELKKAIAAKKPIVVTLWKPFWANQSFPIRPLKDPKNAYGGSESMHVVAHKGFSQAHPDVAKMFAAFKMDQKQYESLENLIVNKYQKGQEPQAVEAWFQQNPGFKEKLVAAMG